MALAAVVMAEDSEVLIGVARYVQDPNPGDAPAPCEFAIVVADAWQGRGIGRHLMGKLITVARGRRILHVGFRTARHPEDGAVVRATLDLQEH